MSWGLFAHSSKIKLLFSPVNSKQAAANHQLSAPKNQPPIPSVKQSVPQRQPQSNNTEMAATFSGTSTSPGERRLAAFGLRVESALFQKCLPLPGHPSNNDELISPTKIGSYTKALPHNQRGEVNANAYQAYLETLITGDPEAFDAIPLGGTARLTNPQSAYAYEMTGPDSHHLSMPVAPSFDSAWEAGEMVELYWQALAKDIPFQQFATDTLIEDAAAELSGLTDFRGPKVNGAVTPDTLFRSNLPGALEGPYISQFLYRDIPYGAAALPQRYSSPLPNPVMTSPDGLSLIPYSGAPLTIGGELNKLASNIGMGRDFAGIHWRSDNDAGFALGEAVAIGILQDYRNTYNEDFAGFSFTRFDGNTVMI